MGGNDIRFQAKRKVVFVNRFFYPDHSATSQILTDLAIFLSDEGWEVVVITGRQKYDDPSAMLPEMEVFRGVQILRLNTTTFGRGALLGRAIDYLTFYLAAGVMLMRRCRRGDILVAKTDPPLISVVCMLVARLKGALLINWVQDLFPEVAVKLAISIPEIVVRILISLRNASLKVASCNVAIGEAMKERLVGQIGDPKRVRVVANWTDDAAILPIVREDNELRREWGLEDRFVVGYSGNLGRAHDISTIVAAATLLQDCPSVLFLFIGGGKQMEALETEVRVRGLINVAFRPYQPRERLANSLGVPDLHLISLCPGLEGLIVPSKFYGVAAAGRAIAFVGDPDGEIGRVVREMECGKAFSVGDAMGLATYIRGLSNDIREVERLGVNARVGLERSFSKQQAFDSWSALISQVAGK